MPQPAGVPPRQAKKEFIRLPTRDLHRATVGIVGLGGVGRRLAKVLGVFRTRIVATDLFPLDKPDGVAELWPAERLPELLEASDFVILWRRSTTRPGE